jgi:hypothetical protein
VSKTSPFLLWLRLGKSRPCTAGLIVGVLTVMGMVTAATYLRGSTASGAEPQTGAPALRTIPSTAPAAPNASSPDEAQFRLLETCTNARAPLGLPATRPAVTTAPAGRMPNRLPPDIGGPASAPDAAVIAALSAHLVHVELVARDSNRLGVDFAAIAGTTRDTDVSQLLEPVLPWLEALSLGRCQVGDQTAAFLARAPGLAYLDLSGTQVTDAGVAALARLHRLSELVLVRTRLSDAAIEPLAAMPALKRVFLWKSGLSQTAITQLRQRRPGLRVDAGDSSAATTREAEPDVKFTSEAPPPSGPAVAQSRPAVAAAPPQTQPAATPRLINAVCPVSGKPVDPRYTIIYHGQAIGFCCPHCPAQFWADPARFEGKLVTVPN